jgi:outer membrane immunogenic protein
MKNSFCELARAGAVGLAAVGVLGAGTLVGHAADLAAKAPVKAAPYNWTGCYAGGFVGYGAANNWTSTDLNGFNTTGVNPFDFSVGNQATGGGTLGCNWQASSWLVLGIEGEGGYLNVEGGASPTLLKPPGFSTLSDTAKVTGYGLIAGRLGVAFDRLLIYGKVGAALYDTSATVTDGAVPGFVATGSKSQATFAVGVGGEYAIYDHWTGKAEYVFFDHGSSFNVCGQGGFCFKQDPSTVQTFKVGINYKFW